MGEVLKLCSMVLGDDFDSIYIWMILLKRSNIKGIFVDYYTLIATSYRVILYYKVFIKIALIRKLYITLLYEIFNQIVIADVHFLSFFVKTIEKP